MYIACYVGHGYGWCLNTDAETEWVDVTIETFLSNGSVCVHRFLVVHIDGNTQIAIILSGLGHGCEQSVVVDSEKRGRISGIPFQEQFRFVGVHL